MTNNQYSRIIWSLWFVNSLVIEHCSFSVTLFSLQCYTVRHFPLTNMKKLTFLLGTLGGAMAGYVFSNNKLRKELAEAPDAATAAKILGKHLSSDGQTVAKEVGVLAKQYHLDDRLDDGKKYARKYFDSAKKELTKFVSKQASQATKAAKRTGKKAVRKVRGLVR